MGDFQTQVNVQPAPAVEGDFASKNSNRYSVLAGPGALVAGAAGVTIGRFAWTTYQGVDADEAPGVVNSFGVGPVAGFVGRQSLNALITTYLSSASMLVPQGFPLGNLYSGGDFWVKNAGAGQCKPGMKAYAKFADGSVSFAAAGTPTKTGALTASVAASTFSVTGSIADQLLTVSAVTSGTVVVGATISGTGIATGTKIVAQATPLLAGETTGGVGRYYVGIAEQTVASTAVSGTYGTMTVTSPPATLLAVGDTLTDGTGAVVGTNITQFLTGAGGNGTYVVDNNTAVTSAADFQFATNVETKWIAMSAGANGELVKISSSPLG
jgi:hypothetical protein